MDKKIKSLKPGIVIRDISGDYDTETYDILYVHADGKCQYSNDIFNNKGGAEIAATTVNKELVANESWDYIMPSSTSMTWKEVLYIPS